MGFDSLVMSILKIFILGKGKTKNIEYVGNDWYLDGRKYQYIKIIDNEEIAYVQVKILLEVMENIENLPLGNASPIERVLDYIAKVGIFEDF